MKIIRTLILPLILGCAKVDKEGIKTEQYKDLVGTWTTDYPNDEERKIIIHKNGKVEIFKSTERGEKFLVTEFKYNISELIVETDTLPICSFSGYYNGKSNGYLRVAKKLYSDTAFFGMGPFINNFETDTNVYTSDIIYTRN